MTVLLQWYYIEWVTYCFITWKFHMAPGIEWSSGRGGVRGKEEVCICWSVYELFCYLCPIGRFSFNFCPEDASGSELWLVRDIMIGYSTLSVELLWTIKHKRTHTTEACKKKRGTNYKSTLPKWPFKRKSSALLRVNTNIVSTVKSSSLYWKKQHLFQRAHYYIEYTTQHTKTQ